MVERFAMSLNIKNEETHRLAQELAELTGESMTVAVTKAVQERLARFKKEKQLGVSKRLLAIGQDCAKRLKEPYKTIDHGQLLYDEKGLP